MPAAGERMSFAAAPVVAMALLNELRPEAAGAALAPLFEGAPRFLGRLVEARPFPSWPALFERANQIAMSMPEAEQVELVDAHPRLGAPPGRVSAMSFDEQGYAAERPAAPAPFERAAVDRELDELNAAYEKRFGFRYCAFVHGRERAALLPEFRAALHADRAAELRRALGDVVRIAAARYEKLAGAVR